MATQYQQPYQTSKRSGNDPKGNFQNTVADSTQRFNQQQGPAANMFAYNAGRASEANYGDYTDIMNQYRDIASGGYSSGGGGGGGGGGYTATMVHPGQASYVDPFHSYSGFQDFANTGGYSAQDIANLRARGASPIRATYAAANREIGRQRSLQGGYSPNAVAARVKMAREQGQSAADAIQNVEAGIVNQRNANKLSGLGGMSNIEGQRLGADVDLSKFNVGLDFDAQKYNANAADQAAAFGASSSAAAGEADMNNRFRALSGMVGLYGTTPGMAETFGNQLNTSIGQAGQFGIGMANAQTQGQKLPGAWDQTMGRVNDIADIYNTGSTIANAFLRNKPQTNTGYTGQAMNIPRTPTTFGGSTNMAQPNRRLMGGTTFGGG